MTARKFYDWQTAGGADDVMRMVDILERAEVSWCAIGGIAVNHWAAEPMVTQDVDFVVAAEMVEDVYQEFASRSVAADIHGMLMRVANLEDTLQGKILAWRDDTRHQSKRIKDLGDIARLVESHPALWYKLPSDLKEQLDPPIEGEE